VPYAWDKPALKNLARWHASCLGDDVQRKGLKLYVVFKRLRSFGAVCFMKDALYVDLSLNPKSVAFE
jgi:predicted transport protein